MEEFRFNLVNDEGQTTINTNKIKGELGCVIVDSIEMLEIIIESELGYLILHDHKPAGVKYYSPRSIMQGPEQKLIVSDQFTKFHLNEKLIITIRGQDQEANITLRYEKA